ncbi:MAG: Eco29kI family restriction endonuclease [Bifidobacteriaceae bacterium]|nr:Eco29kI family restriction endonuclease [Bifidobacteriaceae bacterium]
MTEQPFNPLAIENLEDSLLRAMLARTPCPLGNIDQFYGAGVYAIYYTGTFAPYRDLAEKNREGKFDAPIYVGKAVPSGGRKGLQVVSTSESPALWSRLNQHARSVAEAQNLMLDDFYARWIVTDQIWIPLGESLLIARTAPVWNALIDGFGNHDPGKGRSSGMRSRWDTLHPGRSWAERLAPRPESPQAVADDAAEYLRQRLQA